MVGGRALSYDDWNDSVYRFEPETEEWIAFRGARLTSNGGFVDKRYYMAAVTLDHVPQCE